ncbi:MAG: SDR family NAD(P)-dependent oxidoreductase [Bacteroidales bacterium]|jgi:UDP-glucuronate 4-epimerase|nr:SDR family NAD(P)-dependent oxidoreductase [Bacteroidales bacterium]MCI1733953.1 SDR family NAD(P)-dependent oxidoreductase [Bacteroidales bacterium]
MKILVTGAAGFIGAQLIKTLIKRGHSVIGVDNLNSYYDVELKKGRLKDIRAEKKNAARFTFKKLDITDYASLERLFKQAHFQKVCNLAAQAGVRYSFENPAAYVQSNLLGFFNVMDLCAKYKVKHFIYASSSSIYGNNAKVPFSEEDRVDDPQSLYAATKKSDELMAYVYSHQMKLSCTGLRFFTVYGPWGRPDMAPFGFMKNILEHKPIRVFNNGKLSRDFSYIDDIVEGIVKVIEGPSNSPHPVYNIGNSHPVELMDFIGTIEKVAGAKAVKKFTGMQKGDVYTTYASTKLLEKDYGFRPNTPLLKGITEFYKWYVKFYKVK